MAGRDLPRTEARDSCALPFGFPHRQGERGLTREHGASPSLTTGARPDGGLVYRREAKVERPARQAPLPATTWQTNCHCRLPGIYAERIFAGPSRRGGKAAVRETGWIRRSNEYTVWSEHSSSRDPATTFSRSSQTLPTLRRSRRHSFAFVFSRQHPSRCAPARASTPRSRCLACRQGAHVHHRVGSRRALRRRAGIGALRLLAPRPQVRALAVLPGPVSFASSLGWYSLIASYARA